MEERESFKDLRENHGLDKKPAKLLTYHELEELDLSRHPITITDYALREVRDTRNLIMWKSLSHSKTGGAGPENDLNSVIGFANSFERSHGKNVGFTIEGAPLHQKNDMTDNTSVASIEWRGETYFIGIRRDNDNHFGLLFKEMLPN